MTVNEEPISEVMNFTAAPTVVQNESIVQSKSSPKPKVVKKSMPEQRTS